RIFGTLQMVGDASFLIGLARPIADAENDVFVTPNLLSIISVDMEIANDVPHALTESRAITAFADFRVSSTESSFRQFKVEVTDRPAIRMDVGSVVLFETERHLCIQPVGLERSRVDRLVVTSQISGAGLAFGKPGADLQWAKADIAF